MLESIISFSSLYWISYFLWIYSQISTNSSKDLEIIIGLAEGWEDNIKLVINTNLSRNKFEEGEKISIQIRQEKQIKTNSNKVTPSYPKKEQCQRNYHQDSKQNSQRDTKSVTP